MQELFTNKTKKKFYIYNQLTFLIMFSRSSNTILLEISYFKNYRVIKLSIKIFLKEQSFKGLLKEVTELHLLLV